MFQLAYSKYFNAMDYLMANIVVRRLQACAGFHARCRMRASGCLRLGLQAEIHPPVSAGGKSSAVFLSLSSLLSPPRRIQPAFSLL